MKKNLALCFLLTIILSNVHAQWTTNISQNTIVRDSGDAVTPLIASTPNGSTYISWFESTSGNYELHMQLLDNAGFALWPAGGLTVSSFPQNSALFRYDLKTDHDGNAIVAFQDERSVDLKIAVYKVSSAGQIVWSLSGPSLSDSLADQELGPSIGINNADEIYLAWNSNNPNGKWISVQRISAAGIPQWPDCYRIIDTSGTLGYSRPVCVPVSGEDILLQYVEETGSFPAVTSTMYVQKLSPAGAELFSSAVVLSTKTIPYFFFPQPVSDHHDGLFIALNTSNPVNIFLNDVFAQHMDSAGNLWSASGTEAASSTVNNKTTPSSCTFLTSEFAVLLQVQDGAQGNSGVSVQTFDSLGNILWGPDGKEIFPVDPLYYAPATINDVHDGLISTCTKGGFGNEDIIASKVDTSGAIVFQSVILCDVASNKDDIGSGSYVADNLVLTWQDDRVPAGIYAQNIQSDGTTGLITGVNQINKGNNISIFPNPSNSPVLHFNDHDETLISIYDINSQEIFRQTTKELSFKINDLKNIKAGIYFISIFRNNSASMIKWIKY